MIGRGRRARAGGDHAAYFMPAVFIGMRQNGLVDHRAKGPNGGKCHG